MPDNFKLSCPECFSPELIFLEAACIQCESCGKLFLSSSLLELRPLLPTTPRNEAIVHAMAALKLVALRANETDLIRASKLAEDTIYV